MNGEEMSYFLPRQIWRWIIRSITRRCHTLVPLQNEVEFFLLLLTALFAVVSTPYAFTLFPAWVTCFFLHIFRNETRWQLTPCYLAFTAIVMSTWLIDMTAMLDCPWWMYGSCAVASVCSVLLVCIIPMIPPLQPEYFEVLNDNDNNHNHNHKSPRYPVGVQEAALINHDPRDCDHDITNTSHGSGSIVRVKMYYPTTVAAVTRAQGLVTWDNDSGLRFNASVAVLSLALLVTAFLQVQLKNSSFIC